MTTVTIVLDNSLNSPENNPPGSNQWVGGSDVHAAPGTAVDKTDTALSYTIDASIPYLNTWYYDYGWNSGAQINGPFTDKQVIQLAKVKLGAVKSS
jgi:hypothetical protein